MSPGMYGLIPGIANLTGWGLLIILCVMIPCSLPSVRKTGYFEVWQNPYFLLCRTISTIGQLFSQAVLLDTPASFPVLGFDDTAWPSFLVLDCWSWNAFHSAREVFAPQKMSDWRRKDVHQLCSSPSISSDTLSMPEAF